MNISYSDIYKRIRNRNTKTLDKASIKPRLYTENNIFCSNNAINSIKNWQLLAETTDEAFNRALDIFEEVCINENYSTIYNCCNYLVENVDKVRDAGQLLNSLKYRNARLKRKVPTKVKKQYEPINNIINDSIDRINKSLASNGVATTSGNVSSSNANAAPETNSNNIKENKAINDCFDTLINEAKKAKECDRIVDNYNKISKRFNIDKIISEIAYDNDVYPAIISIAKCIDTYNMPFKRKYSHALEASYYALNKNNMNYPSDKIVETVTDYFIFSSPLTNDDLKSIKEVKDFSVLFNDSDFDEVKYLYESKDTDIEYEEEPSDLIESYCSPILESDESKELKKQFKKKKKEIKKANKKLIKDQKKGNPEERLDKDVEEKINDFRKECAKNPDNSTNISRFKSIINGLFTKTPYQIVFELPNIFGFVRSIFIVSGMYIHPILGIITFITDQIIKLTLTRKQTEKIVSAYQKEIDSVKDKLEKAKDNSVKDNYQKYLNELNKDYKKIKEYENDLYSDDENYDRDTSTEYNEKDTDNDEDDWGLDDDWDDFSLDEAASIIYISDMMESISEGLIDDNVEGIVFKNLYKLDNDSIDSITDFSITVPVILEKDKLCEALTEYRNKLRESSNSINDYIRIDCLNDNIMKLKENYAKTYSTNNNLNGIRCYLACLNEMVNMNSSEEYIMEMNFSNTLKLAIDRLKKAAIKLKDKDKQISNSIDVAVNNVSKGIETALMNDNREAVIKGRILPSASKCIKIALSLGVAWAVSPAIAVITALGGLACSHKLKSKERQLIIDDIDIELDMCERYIKQAEEKNDLKKVRQLEIMQRNLKRQEQRIKYKAHVIYRDDIPDASGNKNDDYDY